MNKTMKTTALVCAALFAVTACSSGGGSGPQANPSTSTPAKPVTPAAPSTPATPAAPSKPATPATPAAPSKPATPATPAAPSKPATPVTPSAPSKPTTPAKPAAPSASVGGNAMVSKNFSHNTAKYTAPSGNMNTSVTVDGRTIDLSKANEAFRFKEEIAAAEGNVATRQTLLSGRKYSHVRFGGQSMGVFDANYRPTHYHDTFAIGNITPLNGADAMPTSGKATYIGDAVVGTAGVLLSSESKFNVDFGAKTIKGYIDTAYEIPLSGKIVGASFSGDQDGVTMKGNFFGPKAAELGGVFSAEHGNSSYQGAFGAKKQ